MEENKNEEKSSKNSGVKKKRMRLSYEDKKKILQRLKSSSISTVRKEFGVTERSLRRWRELEEKIFDMSQNSKTKNCKTVRDSCSELDSLISKYISELHERGVSVSGSMIRREALRINKELGGPEDFKASEGWLHKWKERHAKESNNMKFRESDSHQYNSSKEFMRERDNIEERNDDLRSELNQQESTFSVPETLTDEKSQNNRGFLQAWIKMEVEEDTDNSYESQVEDAETIENMYSESMEKVPESPSELCEQRITVSEFMINHEEIEVEKQLSSSEDSVNNSSWQHNLNKIQVRESNVELSKYHSETPEPDHLRNNFENDATRKKRIRLSYSEKEKILQELDTYSIAYISQEYGLTERSLRKWRKEKKEIIDASQNSRKKDSKSIRDSSTELDDRLMKYISELCEQGVTVTGPMIKQEALRLNKELNGLNKFKASEGWLHWWKKRNAIPSLKVIGESPF